MSQDESTDMNKLIRELNRPNQITVNLAGGITPADDADKDDADTDEEQEDRFQGLVSRVDALDDAMQTVLQERISDDS